jgi:hypothetical protein
MLKYPEDAIVIENSCEIINSTEYYLPKSQLVSDLAEIVMNSTFTFPDREDITKECCHALLKLFSIQPSLVHASPMLMTTIQTSVNPETLKAALQVINFSLEFKGIAKKFLKYPPNVGCFIRLLEMFPEEEDLISHVFKALKTLSSSEIQTGANFCCKRETIEQIYLLIEKFSMNIELVRLGFNLLERVILYSNNEYRVSQSADLIPGLLLKAIRNFQDDRVLSMCCHTLSTLSGIYLFT